MKTSRYSEPKILSILRQVDWAPTLPAVPNVKAAFEARMARRPKDRTVLSVKEVGWLFGEG